MIEVKYLRDLDIAYVCEASGEVSVTAVSKSIRPEIRCWGSEPSSANFRRPMLVSKALIWKVSAFRSQG